MESAANLRMPSDSFSTAIRSSLCSQRNVFSSRWTFSRSQTLATHTHTHTNLNSSNLHLGFNAAFWSRPLSDRTFLHIQCLHHGAVVLAELWQQTGRDGEQVTACQGLHLTRVPEGGTHHHGAVAKLLVVVVNLGHTQHTLIRRSRGYCLKALNTEGAAVCFCAETSYCLAALQVEAMQGWLQMHKVSNRWRLIPGSSWGSKLLRSVFSLYQSKMRPTKADARVTFASAQATAWAKENSRVMLQWTPCFSSSSLLNKESPSTTTACNAKTTVGFVQRDRQHLGFAAISSLTEDTHDWQDYEDSKRKEKKMSTPVGNK